MKKDIFALFEEQQAQEPKEAEPERMPGEEPARGEPEAEEAPQQDPEPEEPKQEDQEGGAYEL